VRFFLCHPGGPFWARKDEAAWSIPKGLFDADEDPETAARREFAEETGQPFDGPLFSLGEFQLASGKRIAAYAAEGDFDPATLASNSFEMEWPPKSGRTQAFPEIDRAAWFDAAVAMRKLTKGQRPILAALLDRLEFPVPQLPEP
jgi:predicted NUDIX family NTP pyrophosphohydrolase